MSQHHEFKFRLYVAGDTPNSAQAVGNLKALCRTHLPGQHAIEIVDVFQEPKHALTNGVFMTPALIKLTPSPVVRIIGTLSQPESVLRALGLETGAA